MHPFDEKRRQPSILSTGVGDELEGEAVKRSMSRFINAIQGQNLAEAIDAWETLCALGKSRDEY